MRSHHLTRVYNETMQIQFTIGMETLKGDLWNLRFRKDENDQRELQSTQEKIQLKAAMSYQSWAMMAKGGGGSPKMKDREESEPATQGRL
jgi:hypothetical protein